ncbi:MAG TPA: TolC family protein [Methylomusa anaerophila]|nr:TolC family protein [Methylomusa anaerophila]HML89513.1 TolC family protein [Methylomusa anaerophila]
MFKKNLRKRVMITLASGFMIANTIVFTVAAAPMELTLDDSVALALKNNPSIKMAEADLTKAGWSLNQAKAGKGPTLSFSHTDSRIREISSTTGIAYVDFYYKNQATLALPLYTGGRVEGNIDKAKLGVEYYGLGVEQAKQQIKLDATTSYYNLLQTRNLVKLNQESVDQLDAHLKNVQAQYGAGTVAKSDVLRSEVEKANAEQNLIKAQNNYDLAMASSNNVMGLPLDTQLAVKDELKYEKFGKSLEDCVQIALANRPEATQADTNVAMARKDIDIAASGNKPQVSLNANSGWYNDEFPGADNNTWSVAVVTSLNVFDSNLTKSQVKGADAALVRATEQARQAKDGIQLEVREAYLNMLEAEKRIDTSSVAVTKAEEDFKIAQVRYSAGVGTNLDVIDSQVALTNAKTNYVQALYDYNSNRAKLEKAIGTAVK